MPRIRPTVDDIQASNQGTLSSVNCPPRYSCSGAAPVWLVGGLLLVVRCIIPHFALEAISLSNHSHLVRNPITQANGELSPEVLYCNPSLCLCISSRHFGW